MAKIDRALTDGEIQLLQSVFANRIDYAAVKVHDRVYVFFQPADTAMAPNGEIYFPRAHYLPDFSTASLADRAWFVHEGAHLYQYYGLKWSIKLRGIVDRRYDYTLDPMKQFQDYGLEEMGGIAQDYYTLREGGSISRPYKLSDYAGLLPIAP